MKELDNTRREQLNSSELEQFKNFNEKSWIISVVDNSSLDQELYEVRQYRHQRWAPGRL